MNSGISSFVQVKNYIAIPTWHNYGDSQEQTSYFNISVYTLYHVSSMLYYTVLIQALNNSTIVRTNGQ